MDDAAQARAAAAAEAAAAFAALADELRNWGRWGPEDELGTLNFITAERVAAAGALIRRGQTFDLSIDINADTVQPGNLRTAPRHFMTETGAGQQLPGGFHYADDYVLLPLQGATQWDALAHVHYDGQMYNGYPAETITPQGAGRGSIDKIMPGVIGRGVLLDVPRAMGKPWLERGEAITGDDLAAVADRQGVTVGEGDVVLIRTGWWAHYRAADDPLAVTRGEPGLGLSAATWLSTLSVAAVAADNYALEVVPSERRGIMLPLHLLLIRDMGMTVGELFDLEALAADCAADGVYEFFFCGPALKITGAVGTPLTPVAVK